MKYQLALGLTGLVAVNAHALPRREPNNNNVLSKRGVDISKFTMPDVGSYTKTSGLKEGEMRISSSSDYLQVAKDLVKEKFPDLEYRTVDDHYVGKNGIAHVNFKQTVHGIDIDNADFHVNVRDGKVFSHGNSFFTGSLPKESPLNKRAFADPLDALKGAIDALGLPVQAGSDAVAQDNFAPGGSPEVYKLSGTTGAVSQPEARLVYFRKSNDDDLTLTWRVETDVLDNWLLTYVDSDKTSEVLGVVDYVSDLATYEVYPWNINDPTEGERKVVEDPWLISASEFTWQSDGTNYTVTRGNNGIAQVNPTGDEGDYLENYRPDAGEELKFEYPYSLEEADPEKYWDASISQLFYTANQVHDLLYVLGFTEEAGNFEANNNGQGGAGNDFVILNAQDGSGTDNANFATPPDGSNGRMRMYLWTASEPQRDCSFEAGVVIHEYIHGLSTRLTGGPANSGCLRGGESGGMGEGWSDFFATTIRLKPDDNRETDYPMGAWVSNDPGGIRAYPYSTNTNTNPHTYADIDDVEGVHAIGTIWCTILYEVLWNLIDKHGKNDNDFPTLDSNGVPDDGKFLALKIVQDAMALQPCSPDFIAARDAIIDADEALTGGDNFCELWKGFAKRGLGPNAEISGILGLNLLGRTEDFETPEGC